MSLENLQKTIYNICVTFCVLNCECDINKDNCPFYEGNYEEEFEHKLDFLVSRYGNINYQKEKKKRRKMYDVKFIHNKDNDVYSNNWNQFVLKGEVFDVRSAYGDGENYFFSDSSSSSSDNDLNSDNISDDSKEIVEEFCSSNPLDEIVAEAISTDMVGTDAKSPIEINAEERVNITKYEAAAEQMVNDLYQHGEEVIGTVEQPADIQIVSAIDSELSTDSVNSETIDSELSTDSVNSENETRTNSADSKITTDPIDTTIDLTCSETITDLELVNTNPDSEVTVIGSIIITPVKHTNGTFISTANVGSSNSLDVNLMPPPSSCPSKRENIEVKKLVEEVSEELVHEIAKEVIEEGKEAINESEEAINNDENKSITSITTSENDGNEIHKCMGEIDLLNYMQLCCSLNSIPKYKSKDYTIHCPLSKRCNLVTEKNNTIPLVEKTYRNAKSFFENCAMINKFHCVEGFAKVVGVNVKKLTILFEYAGVPLIEYVHHHKSKFQKKTLIMLYENIVRTCTFLNDKGYSHNNLNLENICIMDKPTDRFYVTLTNFSMITRFGIRPYMKRSKSSDQIPWIRSYLLEGGECSNLTDCYSVAYIIKTISQIVEGEVNMLSEG
ncbi:Serine/Threonine kinase [Aratus pisonii nudivirus]|nr:Serine/Threonine kinase [Aratus pisonii nudivirus]